MVIYIRWTFSLSHLDLGFSGLSFCSLRLLFARPKKLDIRFVRITLPFYAGVSPYYLSPVPLSVWFFTFIRSTRPP